MELSQEEVKALIRKHIQDLEPPASFMRAAYKPDLQKKLARLQELVAMLPDVDTSPPQVDTTEF